MTQWHIYGSHFDMSESYFGDLQSRKYPISGSVNHFSHKIKFCISISHWWNIIAISYDVRENYKLHFDMSESYFGDLQSRKYPICGPVNHSGHKKKFLISISHWWNNIAISYDVRENYKLHFDMSESYFGDLQSRKYLISGLVSQFNHNKKFCISISVWWNIITMPIGNTVFRNQIKWQHWRQRVLCNKLHAVRTFGNWNKHHLYCTTNTQTKGVFCVNFELVKKICSKYGNRAVSFVSNEQQKVT
jgi:hypothetical protein